MSSPRLYGKEIAEKMIDIFKAQLLTPLTLKLIQIGGLEFFPAQSIGDNVPAIFIKPYPTTDLERISTAETYKIVYNFKIVYAFPFVDLQEAILTKMVNTQKIGEVLIDSTNLGGLVLPNAKIVTSRLKALDWEPPEDNLVAILNQNVTASALIFSVETTARK